MSDGPDPGSNNPLNPKVQDYLSPVARELVLFIERFHSLTGVAPERVGMTDYLVSIGHKVSATELTNILKDPLFKRSMDVRGIIMDSQYVANKKLTQRQMTAAAMMSSVVDRRSEGKRLSDLGISTTEWSTWMLDETFVRYYEGRVEKMLANSVSAAHLGLMRGVNNGNVQAIKLLYEITNRYNPAQEDQVNVRVLLNRVIEVIQKHVKDPEILTNMARELTQVVAIEAPAVVQGSVVRR
jgi:hypothetical protein